MLLKFLKASNIQPNDLLVEGLIDTPIIRGIIHSVIEQYVINSIHYSRLDGTTDTLVVNKGNFVPVLRLPTVIPVHSWTPTLVMEGHYEPNDLWITSDLNHPEFIGWLPDPNVREEHYPDGITTIPSVEHYADYRDITNNKRRADIAIDYRLNLVLRPSFADDRLPLLDEEDVDTKRSDLRDELGDEELSRLIDEQRQRGKYSSASGQYN